MFGSPPWLAAISDTYGFEISANLILDDTGAPRAGLAFSQIDDFLGRRQLSVPFCDYIDPVVDDDDQWHELVDPLLDLDLPLQLRVLDAARAAPRSAIRAGRGNGLALHDASTATKTISSQP